NMVNNYYKPGPATKKSVRERIVEPFDSLGRWYMKGNYMYGSRMVTSDNWAGGVQGDFAQAAGIRSNEPFPFAPVKTHRAARAYRLVLKDAGAVLPRRDALDERIIRETITGICAYGDSYGAGTGIIDSQNNTERWPELKTYNLQPDSDADGMPDRWERFKGLNPEDPEDRNIVASSGYTMLEEYLNTAAGRN
ncbi:MAG: pectate lyase, partial [Bacteroidales bacterium]|nr:pectate lyase [Bacteroidales bacterium]